MILARILEWCCLSPIPARRSLFHKKPQEMQRANGHNVMTELPDYSAEFLVDSIVALVKARPSIPDYTMMPHRNGSLVSSKLWNLTFQGVNGQVSFTPDGDRLNPLNTIFNMQILDGTPKWVDVGRAAPSWAKPEEWTVGSSYKHWIENEAMNTRIIPLRKHNVPLGCFFPDSALPLWDASKAWRLIFPYSSMEALGLGQLSKPLYL